MEREEGELTDEDLEDVSDNSSELSIPIALTGKSPLREPFRELSLTSISDDSDSSLLAKQTYRHISRDLYRKHSHKHRHRQDPPPSPPLPPSPKRARKFPEKRNKRRNSIHRKDYSSVSSSSDDSNYKNKTILRQLRDAVRINRSQNLPNCSLRTRLKRMIEPASGSATQTSNSSDDDNLEILRDQALQSKTKTDSNNVVKLENTDETNVADEDLAQLRLIALKSAVIKKHAERRKRKEEQLKQQQQQLHQEDEKPQDTPINQEPTNENPDNNKSIEEDEDILRAMLLTSISKKIADKKTQPLPNKPNSKPNGLTLTLTQKTNENNYKLPVNNAPINRFIIKVNSDSESDSEQNETTKKPINNNPKNDIFDKSLSLFLQQARAKTEQDKTKHQSDISDISHLPRSQQIEYKRLKRKLQILSTRMKPPNKIKKMATNVTSDENKKILNNVNSNKNVVVNAQHGVTVTVTQTEKTRKDERLMIKGKYEELTPLMSRVSEARTARDKTQAEVKRLINNLRIARAQLTANHQEYTVLVQQLVKAKADIDKRAELQQKQKKIIKLNTSTPKKLLNVDENNVFTAVTNEQTIIPPQQQQQPQEQQEQKQLDEVQIQEKLQQPDNSEVETKADPEINEIQMNDDMMDIDENVPEIDIKKEATILKYNSPLEHIQISRKQPLQNPLLELCPYDLLGVCRDADCLYQHCGVNNTTNTITN